MSRHSTEAGRCGALAGLLLGSLVPAPGWGAQASTASPPAPAGASPTAASQPHPREKTLVKRQWGVEPMWVRLAAAGAMLEFRYRVLDEEKAKPLFARLTKPVLVHEASGATLSVPVTAKVGPLRNSDPPVEGRTYWMFFNNPGQLVKPGERVSVVIGDFRADGLIVQ
jgi:hypothetical protein